MSNTEVGDVPSAGSSSYLRVEDVTGDGGVVKNVISEGTGDKPSSGHLVTVHYVGRLHSSGTQFDSSRDRDEPFEFTLGEGQVISAWENAIETMRIGERALIVCQPKYAYGERGSPPTIPPNSVLDFEVELLSFSVKEKEVWQMTSMERLEKAEEYRLAGNQLWKSTDFQGAAAKYEKSNSYLKDSLHKLTDEEKSQLKQAQVPVLLNLAFANIKLRKWDDAIKACGSVFESDPNNIKAFYRRGIAHLETAEFELARSDLDKAKELAVSANDNASQRDITTAINDINKRVAEYNKKQKKMFSSLLSAISEDDQKQ